MNPTIRNGGRTDAPAQDRAELVERLQAELAVLEVLDDLRRGAYGDFGGGQRATELARRRRELRDLGADDYPEHEALPTRELEDAARRLILPRLRRAEGGSDEPRLRKYGRAQHATIAALRATACRFEVLR